MSSRRLSLSVLLGCLALALISSCNAVNATENRHHLVIGSRVWGDHLLQRVIVQKSYSWFRIVKDAKTLTGDGISRITQVQALDQAHDGTGAYATLVNGGPDKSFVTLSFKSQRSQDINFIVEIYGKR